MTPSCDWCGEPAVEAFGDVPLCAEHAAEVRGALQRDSLRFREHNPKAAHGERLMQTFRLISQHGHVTSATLAELSGMSRSQASSYLHGLVKTKKLRLIADSTFVLFDSDDEPPTLDRAANRQRAVFTFELQFEHATDMMCMFVPNTKIEILALNAVSRSVLGYEAKDTIGTGVKDRFLEQDIASIDTMREALRTDDTYEISIRLLNAKKEPVLLTTRMWVMTRVPEMIVLGVSKREPTV